MDWNGILGFALAMGIVSLVCWYTQILVDTLALGKTRPRLDLLGKAKWPTAGHLLTESGSLVRNKR
jgi:hypothetical protein